jgi:hypothetical protein
MTHGRSPSQPSSPVGGGPGGPGARQQPFAHGRGSHARAGERRSARPRLCHGAQVAGDTGGLMEALGIDLGHFSGGNMRVKASDSKI